MNRWPNTRPQAPLILVGVLLATIVPAASADVLAPGQKSIQHQYFLEGMDAFPDHRFLYYPVHLSGWKVIEEGEGFSWYHLHNARIYAVPKTKELPDRDAGDDWLADMPVTEESFSMQNSVNIANPAESRKSIYRVASVANGVVRVEVVHDTLRDEKEEVVEPGDVRPSYIMAAGLAGFALAALAALIVLARRRKA